ncbi:23S rRNA (adenine(1618)-N(6))-methyltransferase RlmF [Shewanella sp. JM162201]|uniref:Ribosomal RNA large subunit methyltransferase F n=1 Tax=Shewanella jiangmenensis TaxID=2837387 RepID=A0ABS5V3M7_9GAMM|nr:23S rRNA (adenine(1618)-N(6))-methyltransferase RlmF [Shewanella jiangmenensis]MBT1445049.1 23S rRNA (adenine(1618)-N(6))-methyltransferase RlmF [Shewanella jiangmenensis]
MNSKSANSKGLHPDNAHRHGYDFSALVVSYPPLKSFVRPNPHGNLSIDFALPAAVKALNAALLKHHYGIDGWDIPKGFLCPPIPGRVDYLHYLQDLLAHTPGAADLPLLDIGTGANGIYALLSASRFGCNVVATDIAKASLANVDKVLGHNPALKAKVTLRHQANPKRIFAGVVAENERFAACVCNPPFHASAAEAASGTGKKLEGLAKSRGKAVPTPKSASKPGALNFGGQDAELWCDGGERSFLFRMIDESAARPQLCLWFSSLVSKGDNVRPCKRRLEKLGAAEVKVIEMHQGMKITRVLAWRF